MCPSVRFGDVLWTELRLKLPASVSQRGARVIGRASRAGAAGAEALRLCAERASRPPGPDAAPPLARRSRAPPPPPPATATPSPTATSTARCRFRPPCVLYLLAMSLPNSAMLVPYKKGVLALALAPNLLVSNLALIT